MMFRLSADGVYLDYKPADGLDPYRPPEEFLGRAVRDVVPRDVADGVMKAIEQVISTGEAFTYTYELPMDDGPHTYESRIVDIGHEEVLCIVRDLTARVNQFGLTPREIEILRLITAGLTDKDIASRLGTSALTVRKQVGVIRSKMHVTNRTQAAVTALREGLTR